MVRWLVAVFVIVPLVDAVLLLWLATKIGVLPIIALVFVSLVVGVLVGGRQARGVFRRWREATQRGKAPEEGVLGGALVVMGGLLLAVPGVLSDVLGLLLLVPPVRQLLADRLRARFEEKIARGQVRFTTVQVGPAGTTVTERGGPGGPRVVVVPRASEVIETEGETVEPPKALPESTGG